ncbi:MAG: PilN domain-containing protein [Cyanobacteria bacterium J06638_22]
MYSLDINFLNDREERLSDVAAVGRAPVSDDPRPMYLGLVVGLLLPALAGAAWLFFQIVQRPGLEAELAEVDAELVNVQAALAQVQQLQTQTQQINQENQALAMVFDQIQPWSALFQDVQTRTPQGVQLDTIVQVQPPPVTLPAPPPDPENPDAPPPAPEVEIPPAVLTIEGFASSDETADAYDRVNDFVLLLKQSPFFDSETVRLLSADLGDNPAPVEFANEELSGAFEVTLPEVVSYRIEAELTDRPASELLQNLRNALAVGLPARIDALRDLGVVEP